MKKILVTILLLAGLGTLHAAKEPLKNKTTPVEKAMQTINLAAARAHINFLACDELEGREAGQQGSHIAARYIASQLEQLGILPFSSADSNYHQPFNAYRKERQQRGKLEVHPDSIASIIKGVHQKLSMNNVLGMIPGRNPNEYVIIGAHFDHLGIDSNLDGDQIYNGADDNASGVSAVLQIAKAFVVSGSKPVRNVIFAFWDGEEKGLLGSTYFIQNCTFINQIKGYLNFDMIGRNNRPEQPRYVIYFYTEAHPAFGQWLKEDIGKYGLRLEPDYRPWDKPIGGSDNASFARLDIPVIWYHTDGHPDYHQPTDHSDRLNWDKIVEITKASFLNAWNLANEANY